MAGSVVGGSGNSQTYQLLLNNFQIALSNPLVERCSQLCQLLQDPPLKEIQFLFTGLIENIFGVRTGVDWGLLTLDKKIQIKEFDSLRKLLAPDGPLLKVIYKFTEEISPKFEFPFAWLPLPTQILLQEGKLPPLYANKLHMSSPGAPASVLQLNAYEFYFFHFCYFIVNPLLKNSTSMVNQQDTVYAHLLEDYLAYFLPTENRAVPLFQPQTIQHSPILTSALSSSYGSPHMGMENRQSFNALNNNCARPDFLTPVRQKPSLLKKGTIMMVTSPTSSSSCGYGTAQAESWKSETLILILKEILLNQNTSDHQQRNMVDLIPKAFIPTHYHVWMVRIMVKHLHFFFNSTISSSQSTGQGQIMIDSLGHLKSLGMTQLIQKEMYCFLKTVFDHWPLDASFRVPLETYLSYIQPWRYSQCDLEPSIWHKFMTENILFYTTIFIQILRRFLRMDLSCPKNTYMLYRLTKVVCTSDLREIIMQAEKGCVSKPSSVGMPGFLRSSERTSYQKISHLEFNGYNYLPLFSEPVFIMVTHLLTAIASAREKSNTECLSYSGNSKSFLDKFFNFFECSNEAINSDDNSPSDIQKVSSYLDLSSKQLCSFFKEVSSSPNLITSISQTCKTTPEPSGFIHRSSFQNNKSFIDDRIQAIDKKKKADVTIQGDPDLQPVRTYEIEFLVKFFNEVSQHLNDKYGTEIEELYNRDSLVGKICRRVLAAPVTYYNVIKSKDMMSVYREPVHHPPRVNLRILANKHFVIYSFIITLLNYLFSSSPLFGLFVITLLFFAILFFSAILYPVPIRLKTD